MHLPDCLHVIVWDYSTMPHTVYCENGCGTPFRLATGEEVDALDAADDSLWREADAVNFGNAFTAVRPDWTLEEVSK